MLHFCITWEIVIFASAMGDYDLCKLKLATLSASEKQITLQLDDTFFTSLKQEEILGGLLAINLAIQKRAGNTYHIIYSAQGSVNVSCDRCLDILSYPLDFESVITVDAYDKDGYELLDREGTYDMAWEVYETILLELPLQRCHQEGKCNQQQEQLLQSIIVE